ncbi:catalase [Lunatimonas lonarensis]|uniref:Catalase n=1 Tax=Lunatimonas lonarensis TaxID=1232681 RepID=R7ZR73_9BACT|nr:catalase [Lunatimonas lonarensis]EON76631.1 catalase [Lunatimonas lonarensis]
MKTELTDRQQKDLEEMIRTMKAFLEKEYEGATRKRNFHPKMHGCLKGKLIVFSGLSEPVRQGLFKEPGEYEIWARLSNAPPKVGKDTGSSGRGLAIKVLDVSGPLLSPLDPIGVPTQNFLMTTSPILSASSIRLYRKAMSAVLGGLWPRIWFALNPFHWRSLFLTLKHAAKHDNLLAVDYFSGAAFRLGPDQFGKFVLKSNYPQLGYSLDQPKGSDFLRKQLVADLSKSDYSFTLHVQLYENDRRQPLDDTSRVWKAPLIPVATVVFPKQEFDFPERNEFGEKLEFSPWMGLLDHEPIGEINLARRMVYEELANFRQTQ